MSWKEKGKQSHCFLWKSNTRGMLEVWRWEAVHSPFAPRPLSGTACEWDRVTAIVFCGQRVGRLLGGFGSCLVASWLSQSCLHAGFLAACMRASCCPLASHRRWLGCTWKGFQGCRALQAFACHVGVKPWTLFNNSITLINIRQAGCIWLGVFL